MKILKILFLLVVLLATHPLIAEDEAEKSEKVDQSACESDSDCEVIGTGGCCAADQAVNVNFAEEMRKPEADHCSDEFHSCGPTPTAKCENKKCAIVK